MSGDIATGPGSKVEIEDDFDVLKLRISDSFSSSPGTGPPVKGKLFGIGLKVDSEPPYSVQSVNNLIDPYGNTINNLVKAGDRVELINGQSFIQGQSNGIDNLVGAILGPKDTTVSIVLRSPETNRQYEVKVVRHVPLRSGANQDLKWLEVKEEFRDQPFCADEKIVEDLEMIRYSLMNQDQNTLDLVKDPQESTGLGIRLAMEVQNCNLQPLQVYSVLPGGPAYLSRVLAEGDEVVAVDGIVVDELSVMAAIQARNVIGSTCTLTMKRAGRTFDVSLPRSSMRAITSMETLVQKIDAMEKQIKLLALDQNVGNITSINSGSPAEKQPAQLAPQVAEALLPCLAGIAQAAVDMETKRGLAEVLLAEKLNAIQHKLVDLVTTAEHKLHQMPPTEPEPVMRKKKPADDANRALKAAPRISPESLKAKQELERAQQEEMKNMKEQLAAAERAKQQQEEMQKMMEQQQEELKKLREQLAASEARCADWQAHSDQLQAQNEELQAQCEQLQKQCAQLQKQGAESQARNAELQDQVYHAGEEVEDLREKLKDVQAGKAKAEDALAEAQALLNKMNDMVEKSELEDKEKEIKQLKEEVAQLKGILSASVPEEEKVKAEEEKSLAEEGKQQAEEAAEKLRKQLAELPSKADLARAEREKQRLLDEIKALQQQVAEMATGEEVEALRQQLLAAKKEVELMKQQQQQMVPAQHLALSQQESDRLRNELLATSQQKNQMVPREMLQAAQEEARQAEKRARQSEEDMFGVEQRSRELEVKLQNAVPRADLVVAMGKVQDAQNRERELEEAISVLRFTVDTLNDEVRTLKAQADEQALRLHGTVTEREYQDAVEQLRALKQDNDTLRSELKRQQAKNESDAKAQQEREARLRKQLEESCPKESLAAAQREAEGAKRDAESAKQEAEERGQRVQQLEERVRQLADELQDTRTQLQEAREDLERAEESKSRMVQKTEVQQVRALHKAVEEDAETKGRRLQELEQQLAAVKKQQRELEDQLVAMQIERESLVPKSELLLARGEAVARREELKEREAEIERLNQEIARLQREQQNAQLSSRQDQGALEKKVNELGNEVAALQAANAKLEGQNAQLQEQLRESQREKEEQKQQNDQMQELVRESQREKAQLEQLLSEAKRALEEAKNKILESREERAALLQQMDSKVPQEELMETQRQALALQGENKELRKQVEELVADKSLLEQQVADLTAEKKSLQKQVEELRGRLAGLQEDQADLRRQLQSSTSKEAFLVPKEDLQTAQDEAKAAKQRAEQLEQDKKGMEKLMETVMKQVDALKEQLKNTVPREELERAQREADNASREEAALWDLLNKAQLPEKQAIQKLATALDGPPPRKLDDVLALLDTLAGPPARSVADVGKMLQQCGSPDELERLKSSMCPAPPEHEEVRRLRADMEEMTKLRAPVVVPESGHCSGEELTVHMFAAQPGVKICYTLDEREPTAFDNDGSGASPLAVALQESAVVTAVCVAGDEVSTAVANEYVFRRVMKRMEAAPVAARASPPQRSPPPLRSAPPPIPPPGHEHDPEFGAGIGLLLELYEGSADVYIKRLIAGGPADQDGRLVSGDKLVEIDGKPVTGWDLDHVSHLCRGVEGTPVVLTIEKKYPAPGQEHRLVTVPLQRCVIREMDHLNEELHAKEAREKEARERQQHRPQGSPPGALIAPHHPSPHQGSVPASSHLGPDAGADHHRAGHYGRAETVSL